VKRALAALTLLATAACGSTVQTTSTRVVSDGLSTAGPDASVGRVAPGASVAQPGVPGGPAAVVPTAQGAAPAAVAPTAGPGVATAAPELPATGPGWTRTTIYIGVMTQQDVQQVASSLGVNSVDSGDQKADVEAMIAEVNAHGGVLGRQLKAEIFDISTAGDSESQGQAACAHFTQDTRVVATYAMALVGDTPSFRACMAKAKVPVLAGGGQAFDDQVFNELQGYYNLMPFPSWTRFAPAFADRLLAQKFFSGWDARLGAPGTAPTKVGFLCPDTPIGHRVGALVRAEQKRVGHPLVDETYYSTTNADVSGYVLRFQADGITHVLFCDLGLFVFAEQAETQHYRPRYGVSTFNTPVLFLQGIVPDAQLAGAVGVGFIPSLDVDDAHDPGPAAMPAAAQCRAVAAKHGVSYSAGRRFARAVLYDTCDIINVIASAAQTAQALDGPALRAGIGVVGSRLRSATSFVSGLSTTVHAMPAATRDLAFVDACTCFQYRGPVLPM
jgi:hypothetical protein